MYNQLLRLTHKLSGLAICMMLAIHVEICHAEDVLPPEIASVTVGIEQLNYYPHYDFSGHQLRGFIRELLDMFSFYSSYSIEYVPMPTKRLPKELAESLDIIYPDNPIWRKHQIITDERMYSQSIVQIIGTSWVQHGQDTAEPDRLKRLGIIRGFTVTQWYPLIKQFNIKVVEANDADALMALLVKDRVDVIDMEFHVGMNYRKNYPEPLQPVVGRKLPVSVIGFHLSSINRPDVVAAFDRFLSEHSAAIILLKHKYGLLDALPNAG